MPSDVAAGGPGRGEGDSGFDSEAMVSHIKRSLTDAESGVIRQQTCDASPPVDVRQI